MHKGFWLLALLGLVACGKHEAAMSGAADGGGVAAREGQFLAYEHEADITLPAERIPGRLAASRKACQEGRFGDCTVLEVGEQGGDYPNGRLVVRIVPAGVEPFIRAASEQGEVGRRRTHAEDLAQAVADNQLQLARLQKEHAQLLGFQRRNDLSVADMIALSEKLSEVEAQLQQVQQQAAQHALRIDTQKITLGFNPPAGQSGRGEIREAVSDFFATLAMGTAWTIRAVAFLIPLGLLVLLGVKLGVWLFRRRR